MTLRASILPKTGSWSAVLLLWGCGGAVEAPAPETMPSAPAGLSLPVSINEVMVGPIDHAAHELWNVALDEFAPRTDQEWTELEHHAIQIVALAQTIMLPGTGVGDALWVQGDEWARYSGEMRDTAMDALASARNHEREGMITAGDRMLETCVGCHMVYKPDIPSEGELHPHYR